jgi:ribA/ribD-fused uncharacterized protein
MTREFNIKTYVAEDVTSFKKVGDEYGIFSNMSPYPVIVNDVRIRTSEALYQACRFPLNSEVQKNVIEQASPMAAKMVTKPFREEFCRPDWDDVQVDIMYWCLRVKLACHTEKFSRYLLCSKEKDIVENSHKDRFWGAVPEKDNKTNMTGANVLGMLLMELRDLVNTVSVQELKVVEPLDIPNFLLYNVDIQTVKGK